MLLVRERFSKLRHKDKFMRNTKSKKCFPRGGLCWGGVLLSVIRLRRPLQELLWGRLVWPSFRSHCWWDPLLWDRLNTSVWMQVTFCDATAEFLLKTHSWRLPLLLISAGTGSFESDFDKILPQLLGLMLFPFWWSPELSAGERSERISGFEKHYLLTNASISFPTQISTQRKCTISPLWVK